MTFGEMKAAIADVLRLDPETRNGGNPFALARVVTNAADTVAWRNKTCFGSRIVPFEAGRASYCVSDIFQIKAANLLSDKGEAYAPATVINGTAAADYTLPADWRRADGTQNPDTLIIYGMNNAQLYRKPLTARAGGLTLFGWCKPGKSWLYAPNGTTGLMEPVPLADDHECPLHPSSHQAVLSRALADLAAIDERADIQAMFPFLEKRAREDDGNVYRDRIMYAADILSDGMSGCLGRW